jgi:hypothetical protein
MNAPLIARIFGVLFLVTGALGFVPMAAIAQPAPVDANFINLDLYYRFLFGLFPVNVVHDGLHVFLGLWGLLAANRFGSAVTYCRFVAVFYFFVVILGIIPITNTLFGAVPIYGWDIALHAFAALICAYGGFMRGSLEPSAEAPPAA